MPHNKLLFIDLDGTLRNSHRVITKVTKKAIQKTIASNDRIIITSGRNAMYLKPILLDLNINDFFIASDGAIIYDLKNDKVEKEHFIAEEDLIYILSNIENVTYTASNSTNYYYNIKEKNMKLPKISEITIISKNKKTILKLMSLISLRDNVNISNYSRYLIDKKNKPTFYYFDVTSSKASKGLSAQYLYKKLGYKQNQTIAIGDSINDISMFKKVGYKVAMENAIPQLKEISDEITLSNNENGVKVYLEKRLKG